MGRDRHFFCLYSRKAEVGQAPDRMFSKSAIVVKLVNCEGLDKQLSCMAYVIPKEEPGLMLTNLFPSLVFFLVLFRFFFLTAVQFPGEIAEADLPYITALGAGQEVQRQAEVEADQEVTVCRSAPTTLAEVTQRAATKVRKKRKRRINEEGARPEEETMKNDHDLGNTTVTTCERKRELTELIVTNGRRREVGRRILVVEVGHGVPLKGSA